MPSGRGFDKTRVMSDVPSTLPGGSTNMVEGLYRGWDELRTVPLGSQSSLRIIVLFTDELVLDPDHYFIVPQIEVLNGKRDFLWLSAARDPPPFTGDLQTWIRNSELDPDWLRVGTDIVGDTTFNASFSLLGETIQ